MSGSMNAFPKKLYSGKWKGGHCQGIAYDQAHQWMYYSFTTLLVKTDLSGRVLGTVTGLIGHLGCIAFNPEDGCVYGSLEYKNDEIGRGVLSAIGRGGETLRNAFYIAVFDGEKINRENMDASADDVVRTIYLKEVVDDYLAQVPGDGKIMPHRYGCSGIDGITFGPIPGSSDARKYLFVAYGVYADITRQDNDHQILLAYDTACWSTLARRLYQDNMHQTGPEKADHKFFVYTGNTSYGVQNLEYDPYTGNFLLAVYPGTKEQFPNYPMYIVDGHKAPEWKKLRGIPGETGEMLSLYPANAKEETPGYGFPYGSTGLYSFGNGFYWVSYDQYEEGWHFSEPKLYVWDGEHPLTLTE